jgi:hypothetical protein
MKKIVMKYPFENGVKFWRIVTIQANQNQLEN